jgi:membrane-bound lytic murein transglycosylase D
LGYSLSQVFINWMNHMPLIIIKTAVLFSLFTVFLTQFAFSALGAQPPVEKLFPVYKSIRPNIEFWEKVFGEYDTLKGIIHDKSNLAIIYEIVELVPQNNKKRRQKNQNRIKKAKMKYKAILKKLSENSIPKSEEEKRVLELFGEVVTRKDIKNAINNIRSQIGQRDNFKKGLIRSGAYLNQMKIIFKTYNLPEELLYLPFVESSFNHKAYSKYGAAGIWQFTYHTGKRFMKINYAVDERWDPIISTHAAARLLKQNHKALGNWALALTAYNHGANGMMQAIREKGDYESIFNKYDGPLFGFASKNFYSEFLAAKKIGENYKTYFGDLKLDKPFLPIIIEIPGYAPVQKLSGFFNVDISTLKKFNPGLRKSVFLGQKYVPKGYDLKLPSLPGIQESASKMPEEIFKNRQKRSLHYWVKKGDTAGEIAKKHRIDLSDLIAANRLNSRATVYIGKLLIIPSSIKNSKKTKSERDMVVKQQKSVSYNKTGRHKSKDSNDISQQMNLDIFLGSLEVVKIFQKEKKHFGMVRILEGETLGHHADWLNISTRDLRQLNGIPYGKHINLSQKVIIPFERIDKTAFTERRYEFHKKLIDDFLNMYDIIGIQKYHIRKGENIWRICKTKFNVPIWLMRKFNHTLDLNDLKKDQMLLVPLIEKVNDV